MSFRDQTVAGFMDALASGAPTPGGGTASAMAGAMGVSLLVMVAGLPKSKTNADEEKAALAGAADALGPVRTRLLDLADQDAAAFDQVMAAYRLPKASDAEKAARSAAIQAGLQAATTTPLDTLIASAEALEHALGVARFGNPSAASDAGVAIGLLEAAAAGAAANVEINLGSLKDADFVTRAKATLADTRAKAAAAARSARTALTA
ncbi:MAG: cyclodeaminase/cyclohydrolase family protein [Vicinamibacterales bacterium]